MKLLLDENLPVKLKTSFSDSHQISTVAEEGWSGTKNGDLLMLLTQHDFDGLISIDKNLKHQQNLNPHDVKIIIINAPNNKIATLHPYIRKLEQLLSKAPDTQFVEVSI